jgi:hypothetical protein
VFHTIEFAVDVVIDFEGNSKNRRRKQTMLRKGHRQRAETRPYVVETNDGPVEVADLFFDDGTACRSVPYSCFSFLD